METDITRKYNIWEDLIRIINIRESKHRRGIKIRMINPSSPIYEEDSSRGITMRSSRQGWTFEKLNTNQPDAFIDSPFYLLSSIYVRDILAYTSRFRPTTRIIRFDKDYRYVGKVIDYTYTGTVHAPLRYTQQQTMKIEHECFVSTCVWRDWIDNEAGSIFHDNKRQIIFESFPWRIIRYVEMSRAWYRGRIMRDNVFKQSKQYSAAVCYVGRSVTRLGSVRGCYTQVYTSVVPSIDM